jgi:hypothetical protein
MGLTLPGELVTLLQDLGYNWPEADEEKLFELGTAWEELAPKLQAVADRARITGQRVWNENHGDAVSAFQARFTSDDEALAALRDSVTGAQVVGPALMVVAAVVLTLKINVIVQLTTLAIEIIEALATSEVTFGASLLEIPVFKEVANRLVNLCINMATEAILGQESR